MATKADVEVGADEQETYHYLERRSHPWRRQLYLKGRNMTVAHLVYGMRANNYSPEEAAADFELPIEQVREALLYFQRHRDIVERDQEEERRRLEAAGYVIDPPSVPR